MADADRKQKDSLARQNEFLEAALIFARPRRTPSVAGSGIMQTETEPPKKSEISIKKDNPVTKG